MSSQFCCAVTRSCSVGRTLLPSCVFTLRCSVLVIDLRCRQVTVLPNSSQSASFLTGDELAPFIDSSEANAVKVFEAEGWTAQ